MAWRNLWRHRRRTLLTLSSIGFGTMLAVLFTGIGDSNWRDMIDLAARLGAGHVTLQHPGYLDAPSLSRTVRMGSLRDQVLRDPDVERVVPRIAGQLMLSTAGQSYGAGFIAIDPAAEDESTLSLIAALAQGSMFESSASKGIILGQRLADNLDVSLGGKVVLTLTDRTGEIVRDVSRVSGIVRTGSPTVDGTLCLLAIDRMRQVLGYEPDEATQVALFLRDQRAASRTAARLQPIGGDAVAALTWRETQPDLAAFIAMKIAGAQVMEAIIAILVAAGIFNTLFVSVMERMREFGIMIAIGFSPSRLFGLVMFESLWLGLVGLATSAVLVAGPYYYLATTGIDISAQLELSGSEVAGIALSPIMHAAIYPENLAVIVTAALIATLLAGLYPAWQAGRVVPVETIRLV
jgi:ABC-type lipoprotein release transport system permease subunit